MKCLYNFYPGRAVETSFAVQQATARIGMVPAADGVFILSFMAARTCR